MKARSAVLARLVTPVGGGGFFLFTVPPGETWIIKSIYISDTSGLVRNVNVTLVRGAAGVVCYIVYEFPMPSVAMRWDGWAIAEAGDQLALWTDGDLVNVWVSGAKLDSV